MTTLISFLGKGDATKGYRESNYQFDDDEIFSNQKYIGLVLTQKIKPNKLILMGTSGSMWDVFFENGGEGRENEWLELSENVKNSSVSQAQLEPFEKYLQQHLNIAEVKCLLIPYAKNEQEQTQILQVLADNLQDNEKVVLDVTHGFRHLPMLALVMARFLKVVKKVQVKHIYYGAFEMSHKGNTPVLVLDSLLNMLEWVDALNEFDKHGNYGQFADLLEKEGLEQANLLKEANFFERITNSSQASQKLSTVIKAIENLNSPTFNLFKQQFIKRLQWFKQTNRGLKEQQLARQYLQRSDYLRAVIFAMEGMISAKISEKNQDENDFEARDTASKELAENSDSFKKLRSFRNTFAHGNRSNKETVAILQDEQRLQQSLAERFKNLLDK